MQTVQIMGVKVDAVTLREALNIAEFMLLGNGGYITTPNPEMILFAQKDAEFKRILNNATLAIPDGAGIVWAARKMGTILHERITGTDFLSELSMLCAKKNLKLALVGAGLGVAEAAAGELKKKFLDLDVRDFSDGDIKKISEYGPQVMAVALGHEKQEGWIVANLPALKMVKIAIGVGGALDYISGAKRRAPKWMRENGLEWLWRLLSEPRRFKRIIDAAIVFPIKFLYGCKIQESKK